MRFFNIEATYNICSILVMFIMVAKGGESAGTYRITKTGNMYSIKQNNIQAQCKVGWLTQTQLDGSHYCVDPNPPTTELAPTTTKAPTTTLDPTTTEVPTTTLPPTTTESTTTSTTDTPPASTTSIEASTAAATTVSAPALSQSSGPGYAVIFLGSHYDFTFISYLSNGWAPQTEGSVEESIINNGNEVCGNDKILYGIGEMNTGDADKDDQRLYCIGFKAGFSLNTGDCIDIQTNTGANETDHMNTPLVMWLNCTDGYFFTGIQWENYPGKGYTPYVIKSATCCSVQ